MKAKRIAEITDDIAKLKEQIAQLSAELNIEHGATGAAALLAKAIIAREVAKGVMLYAELSAVISTPEKESSDQSIVHETSLPKQRCNVETEIPIERDPHPFDGKRTGSGRLIVKLENGVEVIYKPPTVWAFR